MSTGTFRPTTTVERSKIDEIEESIKAAQSIKGYFKKKK